MKGIIFSALMVRALLAGNKTQTRRPIIPQPTFINGNGWWQNHPFGRETTMGMLEHGPFRPGDVLYVKETWVSFTSDGEKGYLYKADPAFDNYEPRDSGWKWRSPTFMPQSAARIFLKVTNVTAEKLWDIREADAIAEGIQHKCGDCTECEGESAGNDCTDYRLAFSKLWDSIYAKKPEYQWDKNPYVWVISFERTSA